MILNNAVAQPRFDVPPNIFCARQSGPLDAMEMESVALNLQTAARVHKSYQFFSWTQGLLQSLINHEMLICIAANGEHELSGAESFSTTMPDPEFVRRLCHHDMGLLRNLIQKWRENNYEPTLHQVDSDPLFTGSILTQELKRIGATTVLCHGMFAADGGLAAFYVLASSEGDFGTRQPYLVELLLPFIHAAWMRTRVEPSREASRSSHQDRNQLTVREQEVLKWIYLGKSNIEIGLILGISPLTVKNHVQEILRRLNVLNRAQAVGKALSLHLISAT